MQQAVLTISYMCMLAAICAQMLSGSIYMNAVRFIIGLQVAHILIETAGQFIGIAG